MIRLYDPDPGTEPILPSISSLRILQWHADGENGCGAGFERKIDDPEAGRPVEEEDSETAGIVIRRVFARPGAYRFVFRTRFPDPRRTGSSRRKVKRGGVSFPNDALKRTIPPRCPRRCSSHPFAFHPLSFPLLTHRRGNRGRDRTLPDERNGSGPIRVGRAADIALLLNIGDPTRPGSMWGGTREAGTSRNHPWERGENRIRSQRVLLLSSSSRAERRTRVPLPEGDGVRIALLDFSTQASKNLESTIYPLRLGISLRRHSAGLLPRFSEG
jgi:hypothetical protein